MVHDLLLMLFVYRNWLEARVDWQDVHNLIGGQGDDVADDWQRVSIDVEESEQALTEDMGPHGYDEKKN